MCHAESQYWGPKSGMILHNAEWQTGLLTCFKKQNKNNNNNKPNNKNNNNNNNKENNPNNKTRNVK